MQPMNMLFIISDQHRRDSSGCHGHPLVQTPNLDRLAARGVRFTNAYTPCPICVPARAALATGRYVHQIGNWDNGLPYTGQVTGWGHQLKAQGYQVDSIGKLHFRSQADDNGFTREIEPLHVVEGVGDVLSSIRQDAPRRYAQRRNVEQAGPGASSYLQYDVRNADNACAWLAAHAADERPWVLFLSFVCPHPPFIAPPELYNLYPHDAIPLSPQWRPEDWPDHPALARLRAFFHLDEPIPEADLRRTAAAYLGACTHLDNQIGRVMTTLDELQLSQRTRILYTSDHGESMGARGLIGKFTMYEETAGVPLILAGPDTPQGRVVATPVSLLDCPPTILAAVGARPPAPPDDLPGESLWQMAADADRDRTVFSEYHAVGSTHAWYMLRNQRYKYVHYVNEAPQLFDLQTDPHECHDLAAAPASPAVLQQFEAELRCLLDPEATDARAKADQRARVAELGGEAAVRARGAFDNSPTPDEAAHFHPLG